MANKKKFIVEKMFKSSPAILYNFLSTPSGLVQWFADHVDLNGDVYSFFWNGVEEKAKTLLHYENELLRIKMLDDDFAQGYIEYRIGKSEITGDTILYITDFAEENEIKDAIDLWESQLDDLAKCMGA